MKAIAVPRRELTILTPEGVSFGLPLAGPAVRFLAWLIDILIIGAALSFAGQVFAMFSFLDKDWTQAAAVILYFVLSVGYPITLEWLWGGQTPGKKVFGLRVVDGQGMKLERGQIVIRNILRLVDSLPILYLIGGIAMAVSRDGQRLGDFAAGTVVIRQRSGVLIDPELLSFSKYNSLLEYPHLAARLRQRADPQLVRLTVQAIARRDELDAEARLTVFDELASRYRALVAFPEDIELTLTSEQYVRGVLQVLMHTGKRSKVPVA